MLSGLHRTIPEWDLAAAVLPVLTQLVPRVPYAGSDGLALELGEGRGDQSERATGLGAEVQHRVDADQRLAARFEPPDKHHEVEERPGEPVELRRAQAVPPVQTVVLKPRAEAGPVEGGDGAADVEVVVPLCDGNKFVITQPGEHLDLVHLAFR